MVKSVVVSMVVKDMVVVASVDGTVDACMVVVSAGCVVTSAVVVPADTVVA